MLIVKPKVAILDEIDSGLDIDSLMVVAEGIKQARKENPDMIICMITHYQRILNYIEPDFVHVFAQGTVVESGDFSVAKKLEQQGYKGV
jgi:Fe-S cluster assembly ATP-binding protein